ncbi:hypothetical protein [Candidatus Bathycorpusculum sp.]|uniref:hypothetical protein n=1 Tax=Candidatus Bathycorpusculum sp. TaxID=2994959 RepID=UPI002817CC33|nr:hypothetical protein [Candidatus Termitimicrobium sp.]
MSKTQIIWTILPYGTTTDKPQQQRVSVVVSPRLTPQTSSETVLRAFPEFLNWPTVLESAGFSAEIQDVSGNLIQRIPLNFISKNEFDRDLWFCLFSKDTPVNGFQYQDMRKDSVTMYSYSVRNILSYLQKHYANLAVSTPSEHPKLLPWNEAQSDLRGMLEEAWPGSRGKVFDRFFSKDFKLGDKSDADPKGFEVDLYQADRFYRRARSTDEELKKRRPDFAIPPKTIKVPEYDFHRIIASLADYPALMRRLGLVLDFTLSSLISIPNGRLRLHINWRNPPDSTVMDITPSTNFTAENGYFLTRPRSINYQKDGLLNLSGSDDRYMESADRLFDVYQVDPDGAALKTVDFTIVAQNLVTKSELCTNNAHGAITYTTGNRQGVAALRSGGLGVSQHKRADAVQKDADMIFAHNDDLAHNGDGSNITFWAEDVFRGYRVDIADMSDPREPGVWRTLCARTGKYHLINHPDKKLAFEPDEGYVYGASTTSAESNSKVHYLHESLFRWTGWGLCTPRPGLALKAEQVSGSHIQSEVPSTLNEAEDTAKTGCGVSATFTTAKGSLPRLRFGRLYRIRARIVDLAGNSLAMDDPSLRDFRCASKAVGYYRFEPIDPPVMVHRTRVSEGESLERMVIRSNYNVSTAEYLNDVNFQEAIAKSDSADFDYNAVNERHFVPPKSSQQQCEMHGLFDCYFGDLGQILAGYELAAKRESGTLYDELPDNIDNYDPTSPVQLITPHALEGIATTEKIKPSLPSKDNPVGDRLAGGQYVIHGEAQITTPWLPDGAAGGTAIRAIAGHQLPGVPENMNGLTERSLGESCVVKKINREFVILVRNGGKWPDSCGFRLILAERAAIIDSSACTETFTDNVTVNGAPFWDEKKRTLTFFVPKGRIVRLVYASFVNEEFRESFGIPQWVPNPNLRSDVYTSALCGANWLITPFRELTLVHATQAPVFKPKFTSLEMYRVLESPDVTLKASGPNGICLHGPSTGKFEVEAKWCEWVDDPAQEVPKREEFSGKLGEIRLDENHPNRFGLKEAVDAQLLDPNDPKAQRSDVHALGDTRFRLIEYRLRATTRFSEYLPSSIYDNPDLVTQEGPVATGKPLLLSPNLETDAGAEILPTHLESNVIDLQFSDKQSCVLATAPPTDPRVLYVVPTMRWASSNTEDMHVVTREGNSLRVWLDRPWFSSGDGELLGVIIFKCTRSGDYTIPAESQFQQLVTQWGVDPFWQNTSSQYLYLTAEDFPARVTSEDVHLQEKPYHPSGDLQVTIVGHRVHWDDDRHLWYCDIELNPKLVTYMPFIRLALVRYQPNALDGAKVSKVVLTDFAQLLPLRRVTVKTEMQTNLGKMIKIALYGSNPLYGPMKNDDNRWDVASWIKPAISKPSISTLHQGGDGRNRVELVLQTRAPTIDSDLEWTDDRILAGKVVDSNKTQDEPFWEARVLSPKVDNRPCRLMLREFERFYSDDTLSASSSVTYPANGPAVESASTKRVIEERLVFAYIIPLPL